MFIDGYSHIKLILAIIFIIVYFVITIAGTKQLKEIKKIQEETEEFYNNFIKKEGHYNNKKSY